MSYSFQQVQIINGQAPSRPVTPTSVVGDCTLTLLEGNIKLIRVLEYGMIMDEFTLRDNVPYERFLARALANPEGFREWVDRTFY